MATISSTGQINVSVSTAHVFHQNDYVIISFWNFKQQPVYLFGIGNDASKADAELVSSTRFEFAWTGLKQVFKHFYLSAAIEQQTISTSKPVVTFFDLRLRSRVNGGLSRRSGLAASY